MIKKCNNKSACHEPILLDDNYQATRVFCTHCKSIIILRKDWRGVVENREYSKVFRKEILQPSDNLFYKYNPQFLRK